MTLSASHRLGGIFVSSLFATFLLYVEVCRHRSPKVPPQVKVWTLTRLKQHLDSYIFQTFCRRFACVFEMVVMLTPQISQMFLYEVEFVIEWLQVAWFFLCWKTNSNYYIFDIMPISSSFTS